MSLRTLTFIIRLYKTFRGLIVGAVVLATALPVALYIILSSDWAHERIRRVGETELSNLFGTQVQIGKVDFSPFNSLSVYDVKIDDDFGADALDVKEISTRFEIWDLLLRKKIIIDYATISGLNLKLYRDSIGAPLNIDGIISRLSKSEPDSQPKHFRLRLNDVTVNDCDLVYDVLSAPQTPDRFNASHIRITDLALAAFSPIFSNDDYRVHLRSFSFVEQSGFKVNNLSFRGRLTSDSLIVRDLALVMPGSELSFADMAVHIDSIQALKHIAESEPVRVALNSESHIYLPDVKAFVPLLGALPYNVDVTFDITGTRSRLDIESLDFADANGVFNASLTGEVSGFSSLNHLAAHDLTFDLHTDTTVIASVLAHSNATLPPKVRSLLGHLGHTVVKGYADGSLSGGKVDVNVDSRLVRATVNGDFTRPNVSNSFSFNGFASIDSLKLGVITGNEFFNRLSAQAEVKGRFTDKTFYGDFTTDISSFDFKGYNYHDIRAIGSIEDDRVKADLKVTDRHLSAVFMGEWERVNGMQSLQADLAVSKLRMDSLHLADVYPGYTLSGTLSADAYGESIDRFRGMLSLSNLSLLDNKGQGARIRSFEMSTDNLDDAGRIVVASDIISGEVDGEYRFSTIGKDITDMVQLLFPALVDRPFDREKMLATESYNNFAFDFTINPCESLCEFFKLPVIVVNPVIINGYMRSSDKQFNLFCDTQWLAQGANSYIEDPDLVVNVDAAKGVGDAFLECRMPTKKGMMEVSTRLKMLDGGVDTNILWTLIREKPINGNIAFSTGFARDDHNHLVTQVNFNPGKINFGNEIWNIHKSQITYVHDKAIIDNFSLVTDVPESEMGIDDIVPVKTSDMSIDNDQSQSVAINGVLGGQMDDRLAVALHNIQLINIFETLDIDNALISGFATGTILGQALLSSNPIIECDALSIKQIGYNYCTLGDAVAKLNFADGGKIFNFAAQVSQPGGYHSELDGYIIPATESLNLNINANNIKVGFMKPFMSAFTSDVKGYASGYANLYGTFKDIDMKGDIFVDSLAIKIDFTNTWYHTSDSIHIEPGIIKLKNIVMRDEYGNAALLNGWVGHEYFHNASFDFNVTEARNFLCYDVPEKLSPRWYGRIFGDGSVSVKGHPGIVDIKARISSADNSTFTFVLLDQEDADDYSFITFRDVTPVAPTDSILDADTTPERIKLVRRRNEDSGVDSPTNYVMDLEMMVNPQAQVIIVMDPVGGDRIKANGTGNMRMLYSSIDNDLRLYGKYTLEKGSYNFTLQDIIRKDFTIEEGSTIDFSGDPYRAQLDIDAYSQINANLSDLDESFLQDKELNRTNVPVRAILLVRGDMLQPNISFDLGFPTLTQDTYRKVKSIVSTEDMMSKQIIYLLALNRFYTPEYMASTTKGNELFSVASSTLASQLSNMLGKLSDNWSIAPNLRSDRGDFSDLEVDLTLSSSLLNNRLLFNGNFGYRDKSLNTNQFVGDFDLEYLLDRKSEWRLKAYNRYNDQNYYLRTAQTTQGVGIVYRRDFDKSFRFLKRFKGKSEDVPADTIIETVNIDIVPDSVGTVKSKQ